MELKDMIQPGDVVKLGTRMLKVCNPDICSTCPVKNTCIKKEIVLEQREQLLAFYQVRGQVNYFTPAQIREYL